MQVFEEGREGGVVLEYGGEGGVDLVGGEGGVDLVGGERGLEGGVGLMHLGLLGPGIHWSIENLLDKQTLENCTFNKK